MDLCAEVGILLSINPWVATPSALLVNLNPTWGRGALKAFKAPLKNACIFSTFLRSNWPKIFDFQNNNDSYTLTETQIALKKGFYSIFFISRSKIQILKCVFCPFVAKITKIEIKNPKLIDTNDNQWFFAHF